VLSILLAGLGGTAEAGAKPCAFDGSKTVRSTTAVRVFDVVGNEGDVTIRYGCFRANDRRTYLGQTTRTEMPGFDTTHVYSQTPVTLHGRFAANATTDCINPLYFSDRRSDCQELVTAWDLRSGKVIHYHSAARRPGMQNYATHVEKIVLRINGSVGWTTRTTETANGEVTGRGKEVARMAVKGYRLLDTGDSIDLESLSLLGQTLRWTNNDVRKAATLL
jgi:hypothetical protein